MAHARSLVSLQCLFNSRAQLHTIIFSHMLNSIEIFICCLNEMNDWTISDCAKFLTLLMLATRMWIEIIFLAKVLKYRAGTHFSGQEPDHVWCRGHTANLQRITLHSNMICNFKCEKSLNMFKSFNELLNVYIPCNQS